MRAKHGFTLIELLIVITIIGILATMAVASVTSAQKKGRDASRLATLKAVRSALELYYDRYGSYPLQGAAAGADCSGWRGDSWPSNTFLKPLVDEGFLKQSPEDPLNSSNTCQIQYRDEKSGQGYRFVMHMETINNTDETCHSGTYWYCIRENFP